VEVKKNAFWLLGNLDKAVIEYLFLEFKVLLVCKLDSLDLRDVAIDLRNLEDGLEIFLPLILIHFGEELFVCLSFLWYLEGFHG
jgi:hypothetical protein